MAVATKGKKGVRDRKELARRRKERESPDELNDLEVDESFDRSGLVAQMTSRFGTVEAALNHVLGERFAATQRAKKWQKRAEEAESEVDELYDSLGIDGEIPEKSTVMSEADKTELESFRALGKLDEVKKKVEEHGTLSTQTAEATEKELLADAAKLAGNWKPRVLKSIINENGLEIEIREVDKEGGGKDRVPFVREKKQGAEFQRLTDYVSKTEGVKDYLPALTASSEEGSSSKGSGIPYPVTGGGSSGGRAPDLVSTQLGSGDFRPSKAKSTTNQ